MSDQRFKGSLETAALDADMTSLVRLSSTVTVSESTSTQLSKGSGSTRPREDGRREEVRGLGVPVRLFLATG